MALGIDPGLASQARAARADKFRAAAKSLHIELSEEIISKICASGDDTQPVKEGLIFAATGNSQEDKKAELSTTTPQSAL